MNSIPVKIKKSALIIASVFSVLAFSSTINAHCGTHKDYYHYLEEEIVVSPSPGEEQVNESKSLSENQRDDQQIIQGAKLGS